MTRSFQIKSLQDELKELKKGLPDSARPKSSRSDSSAMAKLEELQKALDEERKKREAAEKALEAKTPLGSALAAPSDPKSSEAALLKTFDLLSASEAKNKELKDTVSELEISKQLLESELQATKADLQKARADAIAARSLDSSAKLGAVAPELSPRMAAVPAG